MVRYIASVGEWIASNRLMLNPSKSEFIWFASPRRIYLIDRSSFLLPDGVVNVSSSVCNLGTFFDEGMSMFDHVNRLVRSCFYRLIVSNSSGARLRQRRQKSSSTRSSSVGSTTVITSSREYQNIKSAVSSRSLTWQLESFTVRPVSTT